MRLGDVLGVLIFGVVAAAVLGLVVVPAPPADDGLRPMTTHEVRPDAPLDLVLPIDTAQIKLVVTALADPDVPGRRDVDQAYTVAVVWLGDGDVPLGHETLALTAPPALAAPLPAPPEPAGTGMLAPRTVRLAVPEGAEHVRLAVPERGRRVRVRAFRDVGAPLQTPELSLLRADERDATALARQIGVRDWEDVTAAEAVALARQRWQALYPRRATLDADAARISLIPEHALPSLVREATGVRLLPGQATAFTITAPAPFDLVATGPAHQLTARAVAEDVGEVDVTLGARQPPRWRRGSAGAVLHVGGSGVATLTLTNDGPTPVDGLLLLTRHPERLPADARAVPVTTFADAPDDPRSSVAPAALDLYRRAASPDGPVVFALPGAGRPRVVRLDLRRTTFSGPVPVRVVLRDEAGRPGLRHTFPLLELPEATAWAAPFGVVPPGAAGVGLPARRFLSVPADAARLEVHADVPVLVEAALEGPERGQTEARDATRTTVVRYARDARSAWTRLDAERGARWLLRVHRIRELLPEGERGATEDGRQFASVPPTATRGGLAGEAWLVPPGPRDDGGGVVWCRVPARPDPTPFAWDTAAAERLGGALDVVVWAPHGPAGPDLGAPVALTLDGQRVVGTPLVAPVLRRTVRTPPARSVRLDAPIGTVGWVRTWSSAGWTCPEPHRSKRVVTLAPGATRRFLLTTRTTEQVVVVGGVGSAPADIRVRLEGAAPPPPLAETYTRRERVLTLVPRPEASARPLEDPSRAAPALEPSGFRVKSDVIGPIEVVLTSFGTEPLRVYVAAQTPAGSPPPPTSVRKLPR